MVNEGGSIEVDGRGTLMAKRSSILNRNRNPGWTQTDCEAYFRRYLGVTNFIWLDGTPGADITDDHIDGTARFANGDTIVTHKRDDFEDPSEYDLLTKATDVNGHTYKIVTLPLTSKKMRKVRDYGIYVNYYVGNEVVIVPAHNDPNDEVAADILKGIYPNRKMVLIDCTELYLDGGLVHCVTMQQPAIV
jgi:agmatine deiminase